jgi:hypothetical protein
MLVDELMVARFAANGCLARAQRCGIDLVACRLRCVADGRYEQEWQHHTA